jgi:DNA-binding IclR family transcriptional regulator
VNGKAMQLVIRALRVLRALAPETKGVTLQQLHIELDIPLGSLHRLLATLCEQDFVTRSPVNRRYFLGPAARQLGQVSSQQGALLAEPHPAVVEAAQQSRETVFLTELVGDRAICVALVEGTHPLRLFVRIGQDMPLHAAAASRALLAYLDTAAATRVLASRALTPFTRDTPSTVEEVLDHLALIRGRGYDVCDDELDRGVWAVAAPVFSSTGEPVASVTMAAAGGRMRDPLDRTTATHTVLAAARQMSQELGHSGKEAGWIASTEAMPIEAEHPARVGSDQ